MNRELREFVWNRAGGCCEYCRMPQAFDPLPFEVDHVIATRNSSGNYVVIGHVLLTKHSPESNPPSRSRLMAECTTGASAGVAVVVEHDGAVDDDVVDADVVLKWFGVGGFVENSVGGKERDVGERSGLQVAAVAQAELRGVEGLHFASGLIVSISDTTCRES